MDDAGGPFEVFVVTAPGVEEITAREILDLGLPNPDSETGGLTLPGDYGTLRLLNRAVRSASRVLVRVARFRASNFHELERRARRVDWHRFLPPGIDASIVEFDVTCRKSRLYHTGAVEERLRRALTEACPGSGMPAPGAPAPRFVVRLLRDRLTLSADASGAPLHRRGYREAVAKAPLRETLAAAMVLAAEWEGEVPLVDPFCGSGTLPIEAAMIAAGVPPGGGRRFAFESWPGAGADPAEGSVAGPAGGSPPGRDGTASAGDEAAAAGGPAAGAAPILGFDRDAGAVRAARANAERAGVSERVTFDVAPLSAAPLPARPGLLITNPPFGVRVGDPEGLRNLYARLGHRLREEWSGGRAVLLSHDRGLTGQVGLESRVLFRTRTGGLPVEAVEFTVP